MATTTKAKAVFQAKDGSTHETEKAADLHNKYLDACNELEAATKAVERCLLDKAKTADGHYLSDSRGRDFYRIVGGLFDLPRVVSVYIWPYHCSVDVERGRLMVHDFLHDSQRGGECQSYFIGELYVDERAAKRTAANMVAERLEELTERAAAMSQDC